MMSNVVATLPGILAIFNPVVPSRKAEFEEWFEHEHPAERITIPGFLIIEIAVYRLLLGNQSQQPPLNVKARSADRAIALRRRPGGRGEGVS